MSVWHRRRDVMEAWPSDTYERLDRAVREVARLRAERDGKSALIADTARQWNEACAALSRAEAQLAELREENQHIATAAHITATAEAAAQLAERDALLERAKGHLYPHPTPSMASLNLLNDINAVIGRTP